MNIDSNDNEREETNAMFRRLRVFKADIRKSTRNKDDLAISMISACIIEGMTSRRRIAGALEVLGLNKSHVVALLNELAGPRTEQHRWFLGDDGLYQLHDAGTGEQGAA